MIHSPRTFTFAHTKHFIGRQIIVASSFSSDYAESSTKVSQLFDAVKELGSCAGFASNLPLFGISWPADHKVPPLLVSYFAGFEAAGSVDGLDEISVPSGRYFAMTFEGPLSDFDESLRKIYEEGLTGSGECVREGRHLEIYQPACDPTTATVVVDVCIPIQ